jgi:Right handed beta helix region
VSGNVFIHGVSINGVGITGNTTGIQFNSGGRLTVEDSVIRNFKGSGIEVQPSTPIQLFVSNTLVSDNQANGIEVSSAFSAGVDLSHVRAVGNTSSGLSFFATGTSAVVNVTVSDSVLSGNGEDGIFATVLGGTSRTNVMVRNCTISRNATNGLEVGLPGTTLWFTRTSVTENGTGWINANGVLLTFGDNEIVGNTSVNSAPPSISHE